MKGSVCLPFTDSGPQNEDCGSVQSYVQQISFLDSLQNYPQPIPQHPPEKQHQLPPLYTSPVIQSPISQYFPTEPQHQQKSSDDYFNPSSVDELFVPSETDINVAAFYT